MKLSDTWVEFLKKLPESGMGYHIVDVKLTSGRVFKKIDVYNCSDARNLWLAPEDEIENVTSSSL